MLRAATGRAVVQLRGLTRGVRELTDFEQLSPADARRLLAARLFDQIRYFGARADALPQWRHAARWSDPHTLWKRWSSLPILTKQDLQTSFRPEEMRARLGVKGVSGATGGSTGEPTPYLHDARMIQAKAAARVHCRTRMGWHPGLATICLWGSERDVGQSRSMRGRVASLLQNVHLVDGYALDDRTVDRVIALVARHRDVAIYGFTTMLEFLARRILQRGIDVPGRVRAAWNGGEILTPQQSELFERACGVPILDFYGGRELSSMACQSEPGGPLHVVRPYNFVEVVDDDGNAVGPGETGRLVWTSLVNRGTPFLRYDIGDLGSYASEHRDESGIRALARLEGRSAGLLKLASGQTINALYWNHLFKDFAEVRQFQVAFIDDRAFELRLVGAGFTPAREARLREVLHGFLGALPIEIDWRDTLPRTPQGKLVQVVRENTAATIPFAEHSRSQTFRAQVGDAA